jgi:tRNA nucleotidyltransferase/poly(A) polymerase
MKVFQVGGSVRDELLGVEPKDRDWVVVNSSPEEMEKNGFKPIGKDFPVFCIQKQMRNMPWLELKESLVLAIKVLNFILIQVLLLKMI